MGFKFLRLLLFIYDAVTIIGYSLAQDTTRSHRQVPRIVGGIQARPKQFPYVVFVEISYNTSSNRCTGSILTATWVLTAAHCFRHARRHPEYNTTVTAGTIDFENIDASAQVRNSSMNVLHDFDVKRYTHDMALIRLDKPFIFDEYVGTIRLAEKTLTSSERVAPCVMVGFGLTSDLDKDNTRLVYTTGYVTECEELRRRLSWWDGYEHVCVATVRQGATTCSGDSGGPLVCNGLQAGVLAGRANLNATVRSACGENEGNYQFYMSTVYHGSWIRKHVGLGLLGLRVAGFTSEARSTQSGITVRFTSGGSSTGLNAIFTISVLILLVGY